MKQEDYVNKYYALAAKAGERFNLQPLIILAQGAFESNWGASKIATKQYNFFGITAAGNPNEFWDGSSAVASTGLKFRTYKTEQDSFMDFARLIQQKYTAAYAQQNDYRAYAQAIANSPYISEANGDNRENYRKSVVSLYEKIKEIAEKNALSEQQLPQE